MSEALGDPMPRAGVLPGERRTYVPAPELRWTSLDGETILVDLAGDAYYMLNRTGTIVWDAVVRGESLHEVVERLCVAFDATPEAAQRDAADLLRRLTAAGLIQAVSPATGARP